MSRGPGTHQRAILAALMSQPTKVVPLMHIVPSHATQSQYQAWHRAAVTLKRRGLVEACRVPGRKLIALRLAGSGASENLSVDLPRRQSRDNTQSKWTVATIANRIRANPMSFAELMTADDLAGFLQLKRCTVLELSERGILPPPIRLTARTLRWRRSDIAVAFGLDVSRLVPEANQDAQK